MNSAPFRLLVVLACAALASCASSTMDSIPDAAKMEEFKVAARRNFGAEYQRLAEERRSGMLSEQQHLVELQKLEDRVLRQAHTYAWNSHEMAEQQRRARGEPTPAAPQFMNVPSAAQGGAGGQSQFRSALSQYSQGTGMPGSSDGITSQQLGNSRISGGGALARPNYPGSTYDPTNQ